MEGRSALFCDFTQRITVVYYRRFRITYNFVFRGQEVQEEFYFLTLEDGTDRSSRNVGNKLPLHAV